MSSHLIYTWVIMNIGNPKVDNWVNTHIWTFICLVIAVPLALMGVIFALLKEKGAILVSGFNSLPEEERQRYDKRKLAVDVRNNLFIWSGVLFLGAALSGFISIYFAPAAIVIWLVLFFREVSFDPDKAFAKYRKKEHL